MEKTIDKKQTEALAIVKFLASALADKNYNYEAMQFIFNDGVKTMATDGKRLHIAYTSSILNPGYWKVLSNTKTSIKLIQVDSTSFTYPNVERVIPTNCYITLDVPVRDANQMFYEIVLEIKAPMNFHYIEALRTDTYVIDGWNLSHSKTISDTIKFEALTKRTAVLLHAIIKPMRLNK